MDNPSHNQSPWVQKNVEGSHDVQESIDAWRRQYGGGAAAATKQTRYHREMLRYALGDALRALDDAHRQLRALRGDAPADDIHSVDADTEGFITDSLRYTRAAHANASHSLLAMDVPLNESL